jgi:hypothetical protein
VEEGGREGALEASLWEFLFEQRRGLKGNFSVMCSIAAAILKIQGRKLHLPSLSSPPQPEGNTTTVARGKRHHAPYLNHKTMTLLSGTHL